MCKPYLIKDKIRSMSDKALVVVLHRQLVETLLRWLLVEMLFHGHCFWSYSPLSRANIL